MSRIRKVVLDTNVLVSGIAYPSGTPGKLLELWRARRIHVFLSAYILEELVRVLPSMKSANLRNADIPQIVAALAQLAEIVTPSTESQPEVRDHKDQAVLATFVASGADFLVTGDKDLLTLSDHHPVITPSAFYAMYQ